MKKLCVLLGVIGAVSLAACASHEKAATMASAPTGGTVAQNLVKVRATVESIDLKKRLVTLKGPQGDTVTLEVDEAVKNLPQVKKGDEVVATYYESLAYQVKKPGEAAPGVAVAQDVGTAKPGEKPAGAGARTVTVTATVEAINKTAPSVTLKGPEGKVVTVKVRDPKRLEAVKVGDLVEITYTQAVAISVEKP